MTDMKLRMRDLHMKNGLSFTLVYSNNAQFILNDLPDLRKENLQVKDINNVQMILVCSKCNLEDEL